MVTYDYASGINVIIQRLIKDIGSTAEKGYIIDMMITQLNTHLFSWVN